MFSIIIVKSNIDASLQSNFSMSELPLHHLFCSNRCPMLVETSQDSFWSLGLHSVHHLGVDTLKLSPKATLSTIDQTTGVWSWLQPTCPMVTSLLWCCQAGGLSHTQLQVGVLYYCNNDTCTTLQTSCTVQYSEHYAFHHSYTLNITADIQANQLARTVGCVGQDRSLGFRKNYKQDMQCKDRTNWR